MIESRSASDYRFFGAFRLFLAWLVLTSHANYYLPPWVGPLALGNVGVFSFFALSGFVIAEACDRFYPAAPLRFMLNRLLRIYPTYWVACAVAVAVYAILHEPHLSFDPRSLVANLSIVYTPPYMFFWISLIWAVGIELRFYAIAAILNWALTFWKNRTTLVFTTFLLGTAALYAFTFSQDYQRLATFRHAPYFVFGVALYYAAARGWRRSALIAAGVLPLAAFEYHAYNSAGPTSDLSTVFFVLTLGLMVLLSRVSISRRAAGVDKLLGDLTYPLYLLHWPLVYAIGKTAWADGYLGYSAVLVLSLLAAGAMVLIERPLTRLRDRVRRRTLYGPSEMPAERVLPSEQGSREDHRWQRGRSV